VNLGNIIDGVPSAAWSEIAMLGRRPDWLKLAYSESDQKVRFTVDRASMPPLPILGRRLLNSSMATELMQVETLGRMSQSGVKMFRASNEQCESMEHVDVGIPLLDYRQPYDAMVIEFPEKYRQSLKERCGIAAPRHVFCRLFASPCCFFSFSTFGAYELAYFFTGRDGERAYETIEEWIQVRSVDCEAPELISEAMTRVAMNLCMLLADVPKSEYASAPDALKRAKKDCEANRVERATHVYLVKPLQDIIVRRHETDSGSDLTGLHVAPHWRRGHWRNQHFGVSNSQTKRVFIRPVLVNSSRHDGSTIDTIYRDASINV
jgi:hypothetical protein